MLKRYTSKSTDLLSKVEIGGKCPYCKDNSRFSIRSNAIGGKLYSENNNEIVISYSCDACLRIIPVHWSIDSWGPKTEPIVKDPKMILPVKEDFDFEHVPSTIEKEINEALDCLSVNAFNGFAALCRRSIQAISEQLGSKGTSKVKKQIEEMLELSGLGDDWKDITKQILLTGHDGAHPHLPEVNQDRAAILVTLIQDLTYQLFTRPGKVKEAAQLREKAIKKKQNK